MPVVGHETPAQNPDRMTGMDLEQDIVKRGDVVVIAQKPQPAVGAVDDMVDKSAGGDTRSAGHVGRVNQRQPDVKGRVPNAIRLAFLSCVFGLFGFHFVPWFSEEIILLPTPANDS